MLLPCDPVLRVCSVLLQWTSEEGGGGSCSHSCHRNCCHVSCSHPPCTRLALTTTSMSQHTSSKQIVSVPNKQKNMRISCVATTPSHGAAAGKAVQRDSTPPPRCSPCTQSHQQTTHTPQHSVRGTASRSSLIHDEMLRFKK